MARFGRFRRAYTGGSFKTKKQLTRARRLAGQHRKKAGTLTTVLIAVGGYLVYDKFIKK